jgi:hypothetical protein
MLARVKRFCVAAIVTMIAVAGRLEAAPPEICRVRGVGGGRPGSRIETAETKLLSQRGSTRATRYAGTNKIVTIDGKTHVAWLDSISNTMIATYDHASGEWEPPVHVGTGTDNHGGPALTCDGRGYLHIIFGPHADVPFQHARSAKPNDASQWIELDAFGHHPTYPSAVCDAEDTLHVIYRGGLAPGHPFKLVYQRRTRDGVWSEPRGLAEAPADWKGYTHYHASIAIAANQTLHVAYNLYYAGAAKHAGHVMSRDRGRTWTLADGAPLDLPVGPASDAFFARTDEAFKVNNVVCDRQGHPWISLADPRSKAGPTIYHHDGKTWHSFCPARRTASNMPLDSYRASPAQNGRKLRASLDGSDSSGLGDLAFDGSLTIDAHDRIHVALTLGPRVTGGTQGNVVLLYSRDRGRTFRCLKVFPPDARLPHTGLSLERPTGHNTVEAPWLLFSTGEKGPDCFGKGIFHKVRAVQFLASPGKPSSHQ